MHVINEMVIVTFLTQDMLVKSLTGSQRGKVCVRVSKGVSMCACTRECHKSM